MADDHASQLLETLSSCPEALQELSKALMPSLMKNLTALAQKQPELESDEVSNGEGTLTRRKAIAASMSITASKPIQAMKPLTVTKLIVAMEPITVMKPILVQTEPITATKLLILAMKPTIMVEPTMVPGPSNTVHVAMKPVTVSTIAQTTFTMVEAFTGMEAATTETFRAGCLPHLGCRQ